jgi:hypothetical protein
MKTKKLFNFTRIAFLFISTYSVWHLSQTGTAITAIKTKTHTLSNHRLRLLSLGQLKLSFLLLT